MFVITADQIDSRNTQDAAAETLAEVNATLGDALELPAERTAGDEIQALTDDAAAALTLMLMLVRHERWSIGLGIGTVELPLADSTRASTGEAFFAARDAIETAKSGSLRFAAAAGPSVNEQMTSDFEAFMSLLILVLDRRTRGGWEVYDLLAEGLSQAQASSRLGITAGAVSLRTRAAGIRQEEAAVGALVRMLEALNLDSREIA